ncbi:hypothetical protein BGZ80_007895, partial [Entomortierella chlamydospora]
RVTRERGQPDPIQGEPKFTGIKEDIIWRVLSARIGNLMEIWKARVIMDELDITEEGANTQGWFKWTVQDLYQGLTPKSFTSGWKSTFKTSTLVARYMVGRFVSAIEELGRTEIWNRRRELTVKWKRGNDITSMSKRAKGRTCVGGHRRSRSGITVGFSGIE